MMMSLFSQERIDEMLKNEMKNEIMAETAQQIAYTAAKSLEEGIGIGSFNTLAALVKDSIVGKEYAANKLGITEEEFDKRYKTLGLMDC